VRPTLRAGYRERDHSRLNVTWLATLVKSGFETSFVQQFGDRLGEVCFIDLPENEQITAPEPISAGIASLSFLMQEFLDSVRRKQGRYIPLFRFVSTYT